MWRCSPGPYSSASFELISWQALSRVHQIILQLRRAQRSLPSPRSDIDAPLVLLFATQNPYHDAIRRVFLPSICQSISSTQSRYHLVRPCPHRNCPTLHLPGPQRRRTRKCRLLLWPGVLVRPLPGFFPNRSLLLRVLMGVQKRRR